MKHFLGEKDTEELKKERELDLDPSVGYLGKIDEARKYLEKMFKNPPHIH